MNCANVILLAAFFIPHVLNALAVGDTLFIVYVTLFAVTFPTPSVTYHVTTTVHGCLPPMLYVVADHQLHVPNLYPFVGIPPHHVPSLAPTILKLHATHSFTLALLNVNVGPVLS